MVKCNAYQCKDCKIVFNAKWYRWSHDDGPWAPEPWYYDEYIIEEQQCPECGSNKLSSIGKTHISRKERKLLTITLDKSPLLNPQTMKEGK